MPRRAIVVLLLALPLFAQESRDDAYFRGYNLFKEGKLTEAEAAFQAVFNQTPPDFRGLMGLTEVYAAQNNYDRALRILDEQISKGGPLPLLKTAWANIAVRAGRFKEGIAVYQELLTADPSNFDLHMRLAESFRQKQDLPSAIDIWEKASRLNPDSITPVLSRAMALDQTGRKAEAFTAYTEVLRLDPSNNVANNNAAYLLAESNTDLDRALQYATTAATDAPLDPNVADTLGFVHLKRKEPKEAAKIFQRLTAEQPKNAVFHIRHAEALRMSGDAPGASRECALARPLVTPAYQADFNTHCPAAK